MKDWMAERKWLIVLLVLQLIVTIPFLASFPIELDEPFTIFYSQQDISTFLPFILQGNNPPLFFMLLHFWIEMFGIDVLNVRFFSVLISLLGLIILFGFIKKETNEKAAILCCLLFIFSRDLHLFSMEARMYGLYFVCFILIFSALYRYLKKGAPVQLYLLVLGNILMLYTHYLGALIIVFEFLILLLYVNKIREFGFRKLLAPMLTLVVLIIPLVSIFLTRSQDFLENGTWIKAVELKQLYGELLKLVNNPFALIWVSAICIVFYSVGSKVLKLKIEHSSLLKYALIWFLLIYFGMFLFSLLIQPVFLTRYLVLVILPIIVLISAFLTSYSHKFLRYASFLVIIPFLFSVNYSPNTNRDSDVMIALASELKSENTSLVYYPEHYVYTVLYHLEPLFFKDYEAFEELLIANKIYTVGYFQDIEMDSNEELILLDFDGSTREKYPAFWSQMNTRYKVLETQLFKANFELIKFGR